MAAKKTDTPPVADGEVEMFKPAPGGGKRRGVFPADMVAQAEAHGWSRDAD